jgi:hypothetical protein
VRNTSKGSELLPKRRSLVEQWVAGLDHKELRLDDGVNYQTARVQPFSSTFLVTGLIEQITSERGET